MLIKNLGKRLFIINVILGKKYNLISMFNINIKVKRNSFHLENYVLSIELNNDNFLTIGCLKWENVSKKKV
jgi:hypothetical protein